MSYKILLREDIWRGLNFQNRSHYFGRSVTLQWQDQVDYLRTAVQQALLSGPFQSYLAGRVTTDKPIERWTRDEVLTAWSALVGERMKGGKTTFTRNWVWNRLADGNGDHEPALLAPAVFQRERLGDRPGARSPVRAERDKARALIASLAVVSEEALGALEEEFAELLPVFDLLRRIGRTPLDASDLTPQTDLVPLAREVGLPEIYEGAEDDVRRYRIPDLFRLGLGMTRMGQI